MGTGDEKSIRTSGSAIYRTVYIYTVHMSRGFFGTDTDKSRAFTNERGWRFKPIHSPIPNAASAVKREHWAAARP